MVSRDRIHYLRTCPYREYLDTPEWKTKREAKIWSVGGRCQLCNSDGPFNVHHRTYERRGNEDFNDLTVLCFKCHEKFHGINVEPDKTDMQGAEHCRRAAIEGAADCRVCNPPDVFPSDPQERWRVVIKQLGTERPAVATIFGAGRLVEWDSEKIVVAYRDGDFAMTLAKDEKYQAALIYKLQGRVETKVEKVSVISEARS